MPAIRPGFRIGRSGMGKSAFAPIPATQDRLADLPPVRGNPGQLAGRYYVPEGLKVPAPLVVVLHGCTQNAAVYDHGSGWSRLADKHGFILLFPEQSRANNPMLCFNWFSPDDATRGKGEAASIAAMIAAMKTAHAVDPERVFVTGLSAGGAMASVMLACYPELFASGAIIAGVAYGGASDMAGAFACMSSRAPGDVAELGAKVRSASPHTGPWPRVQIWHGSADHTVAPGNGDAIAEQWARVHGLEPKPDREDRVAGHPRRAWLGADGMPLVEQYEIKGMAHGVPLDPGTGEGESGAAGAHMLDVGLSSTDRIAAFFGIAPEPAGRETKAAPRAPAVHHARPRLVPQPAPRPEPAGGVQAVIEKALKAAGLMR